MGGGGGVEVRVAMAEKNVSGKWIEGWKEFRDFYTLWTVSLGSDGLFSLILLLFFIIVPTKNCAVLC